jgi:hypothetical protein
MSADAMRPFIQSPFHSIYALHAERSKSCSKGKRKILDSGPPRNRSTRFSVPRGSPELSLGSLKYASELHSSNQTPLAGSTTCGECDGGTAGSNPADAATAGNLAPGPARRRHGHLCRYLERLRRRVAARRAGRRRSRYTLVGRPRGRRAGPRPARKCR